MKRFPLFLSAAATIAIASPCGAEPDFEKEIKPILEARCVKCHGASKMEGELDLSNREMAEIGGEFGPALVGGDSENSLLFQRITLPRDDEEAMPTKGKPLSKEQIRLIKEWIDAGAAWPEDLVLKERKPEKQESEEPGAESPAPEQE